MKTIALLFIISLSINGVFGDEVKSVSVIEGDSVTLHTDLTKIQRDYLILWRFRDEPDPIATIDRVVNNISIYDDVLDGRFRDRLQVNDQTGDLIITNITTQHTGLYILQLKGVIVTTKNFSVNGVVGAGGVNSVSVLEGDSLTLHTDVPDINKYDEIRWKFHHENSPLAEINRNAAIFSTYDDAHDGIFKGRMQLNCQTGSLTITNIRIKHSGFYEVNITSSGSYTIHQSFTVIVSGKVKSVSVMEGDPVTLHTDSKLQTDEVIVWRFLRDDSQIAQIYKQSNLSRTYDGEDGRFRDRMKLNDQTGDLTITDSKPEYSGAYELKMNIRRRSIQRRFSIHVSERGLSPGAIVGICVFLLLLIAAVPVAGLIYYRRKIFELGEIERLQVDERRSVYLNTEVTDIERDDLIEWRFGETLIAEINPARNIFSTYDDLFRDMLMLNHQTGDLVIHGIKPEHQGDYKLKIIRGGKTSYKRFRVHVTGEREILEVFEGESADLETEVKDIHRVDLIEWRFEEKKPLIAEINPANKIFSTYDGDDDLFRDKLKLNPQTGDLIISDIRMKHRGDYKLKLIRDGETSYKKFRLVVRGNLEVLRVNEGESVLLKIHLTDIQSHNLLEWRFEETLIAEINPANNIFRTYDKGRFRDKLKLNHQTGDLNINDVSWEHTGFYILKIIRGEKTSYKTISMSVTNEIKILEVDEGKSVNLETEVTDIQRDLIQWRFGRKETLIADINPACSIFSTYDGDDGLFRDKIEVNPQNGNLTINDIRWEHTGVYKLKIIRGEKASYRRFSVFVRFETETLRVKKGDSVDLETDLTEIQRDDLIEWRFGIEETLIAKINPANNIFSTYDGDDDLFRDKLELNPRTGDLTINDILKKHTRVYILKIISDGETSYKRFRVVVRDYAVEVKRVNEGESCTLKNDLTDKERDDVMEWRFEGTVIAQTNPDNCISRQFNGDDRLKLNYQNGDINISNITVEHDGVYTLWIIRGGLPQPTYKSFRVFVKVSVYEGKSLYLKTKVTDVQRVEKIEWRFRKTLIAEINPANNIFSTYNGNDDLFRYKLKLNHQTGDLTINDVRQKHDGVYKLRIIKGRETSDRRFRVIVTGIEIEDSVRKRREDSVGNRGKDSVEIEMEPLLPNSSQ
nr:uncharacterized protein LOC129452788 isoform X1 [Misgurnus anguillicaudatus]